MKSKWAVIIMMFVLCLVLLWLILGLIVKPVEANVQAIVPPGSSQVKLLGDGWFEFSYKSNLFLAYMKNGDLVSITRTERK